MPIPTSVGELTLQSGCFTLEEHIRGMTLKEIGKELGLPDARLIRGGWIVFALTLPFYDDFELGGWAEFSTDHFIKNDRWSRLDYEKTYKGKRMPISVMQAKNGWLQDINNRKLVKLVLNEPHNNHQYPAGGLTPQIIVTKALKCLTVMELKPNSMERFRGVWR